MSCENYVKYEFHVLYKVLCNTACSSVQILSMATFVQRWVVAETILSFIESLLTPDPDNTNVGSGFVITILFYWISLGPRDHFR